MDMGLSLALRNAQAGAGAPWEASVHIDGTTFTTNQLLPGLPGAYDATTTANRVYWASSSGASLPGGSLWSAVIKGTSAKLVINRNFGGGFTNAVYASVDGGAFVNIPEDSLGTAVKGFFTLFTGLSDAEHYVVVRAGTGYGDDSLFWNTTHTDALALTGTSTYIEMCNQWVYAGVTDAYSVCAGMTKASTVNFVPNRSKQNIVSQTSNISMAKIRGKFRSIQIASTGAAGFTKAYVSKNGAAPTVTSFTDPSTGGTTCRVTGLTEETATYYVWTDHNDCSMFAVSGDADHVDCGNKYQIHQFGDSITYGGGPAAVPGAVDTTRVAAALGYVGVTGGVAGKTVEEIDTALTTYLAALTVTSNDVAIVAAGRNNPGAAWVAATNTAYDSIISKLLAKGYGKIICRGILPDGNRATTYPTENGYIQARVTAAADAKVVFCDVSSCPTFTTQSSDNTHPDTAGYITIATYVEPLYRAILGI